MNGRGRQRFENCRWNCSLESRCWENVLFLSHKSFITKFIWLSKFAPFSFFSVHLSKKTKIFSKPLQSFLCSWIHMFCFCIIFVSSQKYQTFRKIHENNDSTKYFSCTAFRITNFLPNFISTHQCQFFIVSFVKLIYSFFFVCVSH